MADKKKLSVEEILAACRTGTAAAPAKPAAPSPKAPEAAAPEPEAPSESLMEPIAEKPKPAAVKPGSMSVADILAAARTGKAPAKAEAPAPKPAAEAKPKPAAPAAEKAAAKPTAKGAPALDTASILAAARGPAKPGPMSKAEAAAKGKDAPEGKKKLEVPPMPGKPSYAQAQAKAPAKATRRGFIAGIGEMIAGSWLALGFSSLAVTQLLWGLGLARFMFPNILIEPPTRFKVGFPDALAPGQVDERYKAQFGVWIVKYEYAGQAQIFAVKTVCTHLGCTPNWLEAEQKFKCPCHGSGFYKDGINFEGPAPRPLERYAIKIADDGQLEVDKSRVYFEEKGEWGNPASFVSV